MAFLLMICGVTIEVMCYNYNMKIPAEIYLMAAMVFGAVTHAAVQFDASRKKGEPLDRISIIILFIIAVFSGGIFGLTTYIVYPDNILIVILATATGSFLGLTGLNKITSAIPDILISFLSRFK